MVKATLMTRSGTSVVMEGTPAEVEETVRRLESQGLNGSTSPRGQARSAPSPQSGTIKGYVLELQHAGGFKTQQGLGDVQKALEAEGHLIPRTTLSGVMLGLVQEKHLRRIKVAGVWKYVNR